MDVVGPMTETRSTREGSSAMGTAAQEGRSKQDSCLEGARSAIRSVLGGEEGRQ